MKKVVKDKDNGRLADEIGSVMAGSRINWDRSRDEIWNELEKKLEVKTSRSGNGRIVRLWPRFAAAAGVAVLLGLAGMMTLITRTIRVPAGQHSEIYLPDKSLVRLNANSTLSYKPIFWKLSRTMNFEGEGYFEVIKGKKFEVRSSKGTTSVLGTTFNVFSRDNSYQVTCLTGRVKVRNNSGDSNVILNPGEKAALNPQGLLKTETGIDTKSVISWISNKFSFTAEPLKNVFDEISRQYGVSIKIPENLDNTYTGTFIKGDSVASTLGMVCRPFDLEFIQESENEYVIAKSKSEGNN